MTPQEMVKRIHKAAGKGCIVVAGAGAKSLSQLLAEPGASNTVLDAQIPYSREALEEYVHASSDQHVSLNEAKLMAASAFKRAQQLASEHGSLFGVGCTAAVATDRDRKGDDRAYIAWTNGISRGSYSIWFDKARRSRRDEEDFVSRMVLNAIAAALGIEGHIRVEVYENERVDESL